MLFANQEHYDFFKAKCAELTPDRYHRSLAYLMGICPETRDHWNEVYDGIYSKVLPETITKDWHTVTTQAVTFLAFQLFSDNFLFSDERNWRGYSVARIFNNEYAPLLMEAVKMRYTEYFSSADYPDLDVDFL